MAKDPKKRRKSAQPNLDDIEIVYRDDDRPEPNVDDEVVELGDDVEEVIEEVELVDDVVELGDDAVLEVDEADTGSADAGSGPPPLPSAPKTKISSQGGADTHLARSSEPLEIPDSGKPTDAPAEKSPKTKIAGKSSVPTQLSQSNEPMDIPGSELGGQQPPKSNVPDMEIDDEVLEVEEVEEVQEVEPVDEVVELDEVEEVDEFAEVEEVKSDATDMNDLLAEEMLLHGEEENKRSDQPSGVDLIPDAMESEINLGNDKTNEDDSGLSFDSITSDDSSAVDLGSSSLETIDLGLDDYDATSAESDVKALQHDVDATQAFSPEEEANAKSSGSVRDDEVVIEDNLLDEDEVEELGEDAVYKTEDEVVDVDESLLLDEATEKQKSASAEEDDDLLAAAAAEASDGEIDEGLGIGSLQGDDDNDDFEEAPVATKKKSAKKKSAADDDDDDDDSPKKSKKKAKVKKPKYFARWVGGTFLGMLLLGGAAAGVWYFVPEYLDLIPQSPNAKTKTPTQPIAQGPKLSPVEQAQLAMGSGDFDKAINIIGEGASTPEELSTRAQAKWSKYLLDAATNKQPLNPNAPPVQEVLKDLDQAKNDLLKQQIMTTLQWNNKVAEVNKLQTDVMKLTMDLQNASKTAMDNQATINAMLKTLADNKLVADPTKFDLQMFPALAKDLANTKADLAKIENILSTQSGMAPSEAMKLVKLKSDLDAELKAINAKLADAMIASNGTKGVQELLSARADLQAKVDSLRNAAVTAFNNLNDGKTPPPAKLDELVAGLVKQADAVAKEVRSPLSYALKTLLGSAELAALDSKLELYKQRESLLDTPEKKLDTWINLFAGNADVSASQFAKAKKDADWLTSKYAQANPEDQAKATYLLGLLAMNQDQFAMAKSKIQEALASAKQFPAAPEWMDKAQKVMAKLTDPSAFYLPEAKKLASVDNYSAALNTLDTGLKAIPNNPQLIIERALLTLDSAKGKTLSAEQQQQIKSDATAALASENTIGMAQFALGRLAEEMGQLTEAEAKFREAMKTANGDLADQCRIALARVLLQQQNPAIGTATPEPAANEKTSFYLPSRGEEELRRHFQQNPEMLQAMLTAALTGLQVDDFGTLTPKEKAKIQEIMDLAEELLKSSNPEIKGQGLMFKGEAMSMSGKRTEGLKTFVDGLKLRYPGLSAEKLEQLIDSHPAFQVPDSLNQPNPVLAETHFARGMQMYWDDKFSNAEEQFKQAISYSKNDARYFYFLGLSQLGQKTKAKRELAYYNLEQASRLEMENLPGSDRINFALERIQGPLREFVNGFRRKAALAN